MKQIIQPLLTLLFLLPFSSYSQPDFKKGFIVSAGAERIEGLIRESLKSKGTIIFLSPDGSRATFEATDILSFAIDNINYLSWSNDFCKEISSGAKANLYQKVTDNSNKQLYNGPEMVGFLKTTEGKKGDLYIFLHTDKRMNLITQKHFERDITKLFTGSNDLQIAIKNRILTYSNITETVKQYNSITETEKTSASTN